jgi:hypothetical protein
MQYTNMHFQNNPKKRSIQVQKQLGGGAQQFNFSVKSVLRDLPCERAINVKKEAILSYHKATLQRQDTECSIRFFFRGICVIYYERKVKDAYGQVVKDGYYYFFFFSTKAENENMRCVVEKRTAAVEELLDPYL